jgi:hypothetical protein
MAGIEVRLSGGTWASVPVKTVKKDLQNSLDFINHYDMIETPINRMQILDFAAPAFLEALPKFGKLLEEMDGKGSHPAIEDVLDDISSALRALPASTDIWDWPDTPANRAALRHAFSCCRYYSYGPALITKLLHLKRRRLVVPVDSRLRRAWPIPTPRGAELDELVDITFDIGRELRKRRASLARLRRTADAMGWPYNRLSTLRLYDVISWWNTA